MSVLYQSVSREHTKNRIEMIQTSSGHEFPVPNSDKQYVFDEACILHTVFIYEFIAFHSYR